ncbi:hypothetical protein HOV04_gp75 [Xanthomonas phage XcP1]|uniref:Uncharacterized protein n=1 Tax=Xanthomonas phage XcP1 TaxID=2785027 RepID=A0A3S7L8Q0_9CAUD|nr:hypothetical protein HOV04_gp75 [Xanthomonas phage XcP1]AWN08577.1 hypothetical protein XcP1_075 [Xanthomonas phage XcP1]
MDTKENGEGVPYDAWTKIAAVLRVDPFPIDQVIAKARIVMAEKGSTSDQSVLTAARRRSPELVAIEHSVQLALLSHNAKVAASPESRAEFERLWYAAVDGQGEHADSVERKRAQIEREIELANASKKAKRRRLWFTIGWVCASPFLAYLMGFGMSTAARAQDVRGYASVAPSNEAAGRAGQCAVQGKAAAHAVRLFQAGAPESQALMEVGHIDPHAATIVNAIYRNMNAKFIKPEQVESEYIRRCTF